MLQRLLFLLTGVSLLTSCRTQGPDIMTLCLRDEIGNYVIKWETDPPMDGTVKLYVSPDPDQFNRTKPVGYSHINDHVTTYITSDNLSRQYFMLSFNDRYTEVVSSREVVMDNVLNLRDMGGYPAEDDKTTRWGKVYRSGALSSLTERDSIRLNMLGVKTIIDLRTEEEVWAAPVRYGNARVVHTPVKMGNVQDIHRRLLDGRIRKGDGILFMQDLYLQFISDNSEVFAEAMEVFLDPSNYPILFSCSYGKDRTGFLAAMLLSALEVPENVIMNDYMMSNDYKYDFFDLESVKALARRLNPEAQETVTVMLTTNEAMLELAFRKIRKDYGSVGKYLSEKLQLTDNKRTQLKDIMLF